MRRLARGGWGGIQAFVFVLTLATWGLAQEPADPDPVAGAGAGEADSGGQAQAPTQEPAGPAVAAGGGLPAFELRTAAGETIRSSALERSVVVLCVVGVGFEPCRAQAPVLRRIDEMYAPRGVRVLVMAIDRDPMIGEPRLDDMLAFAREFSLACPILVPTATVLQALAAGLPEGEPLSYPTTFVFDRRGAIVQAIPGVVDGDVLGGIVEEALSTAGPARERCPVCGPPPAPPSGN